VSITYCSTIEGARDGSIAYMSFSANDRFLFGTDIFRRPTFWRYFSFDCRHFGCDCADGFKGDHCQFSANVPDDWPTLQLSSSTASTTDSRGIGAAATSVISLMAIAVVFIVGFFGVRRYNTRQSSDVPVEQPDPELTMAGSGDAGASLPHPDEVRQQVAEGTASPKRRSEPNAVTEGDEVDESTMEEVNMGSDII
jgi:hypothetical protein